jgi:hypothetical protein
MDVIANITGTDHGESIMFTVDWRDGSTEEPRWYASHENGVPEWIWNGNGGRFKISAEVVTREGWQDLLKEIQPHIDSIVKDHADEKDTTDAQDNVERIVGNHDWPQAGVWKADDWLDTTMAPVDAENRTCHADDAVMVNFDQGTESAVVITALTSDEELAEIEILVDSDEECHIVNDLLDYLETLRDQCLANAEEVIEFFDEEAASQYAIEELVRR